MVLLMFLLLSVLAFAKDVTPAQLAAQATAVIKSKGIAIPAQKIPETKVTLRGWYYETSQTCGVTGATTYLEASDGTTDLVVSLVVPMHGNGPDVTVSGHDLNGDGVPEFMSQEGSGVPLPENLTRRLFTVMLKCVISPPPAR